MVKKGVEIELPVLKAAPGWLAVHKPAGLSVHNDPREDLCARVRRRIEADADLKRTTGLDRRWGVHAVHRLDRDTSGVLLLATCTETFTALSDQFRRHEVRKRYLTVVHGHMGENAPERQGSDATSGEWSWPLSARAGGRNRPAGAGKRHPSRTRFRVEGCAERYTLLSCEPVNGRQHQIRRHAKISGHPVVGDRRYGSKRALAYLEATYPEVRLALHAWQLSFIPPNQDARRRQTLTADPVPDFIQRLMGGFDVQGLKARSW